MSTFIEVQNRINQDYLNRTTFASETKRAIQASVRHFEYKRWGFNETSTALTTVAGQSYLSLPSNFLVLDDLRIILSSERLYLNRRDSQTLRDWNTAVTNGQPTDYAIYQNRIEFFPVPDSAYSIPIYYIKQLTELSADNDTNGWLTGLWQDVIAYHAAKLMWANVLRNDTEASKFAILEKDALDEVTGHLEQHLMTGLKATQF